VVVVEEPAIEGVFAEGGLDRVELHEVILLGRPPPPLKYVKSGQIRV